MPFLDPRCLSLQDYDDDGEIAGGRLLKLLTLVGAEDVVDAVSWWSGAVLLGPVQANQPCCQTTARQVRLRQYQADKDQQQEMTSTVVTLVRCDDRHVVCKPLQAQCYVVALSSTTVHALYRRITVRILVCESSSIL